MNDFDVSNFDMSNVDINDEDVSAVEINNNQINDVDSARHDVRTMSHASMVAAWRTGHAVPVSPRITEYARYDDIWWRRVVGSAGPRKSASRSSAPGVSAHNRNWESIPDGPFALILTMGRNRLESLTGGVDSRGVAADGYGRVTGRDPWSIARDRMRMGGTCTPSHASNQQAA